MSRNHHRQRAHRPAQLFSAGSWRFALPAVLALALLAYANTHRNAFVYDDAQFILHNEALRGWDNFHRNWTESYPPHQPGSQWRPLTATTLFFNRAMGLLPLSPTFLPGQPDASTLPFHITNILLHLGVCALVYGFFAWRWGRGWGAFTAGALFAVHPVHVEGVTAIIGRAESLATLGVLGGVWLLARSDPARGFRDWRLGAALGAAFLGMLSKESAAAFVVVAAVAGWFPRLLARTPEEEAARGDEGGWIPRSPAVLRRRLGWGLAAFAVFLLYFVLRMNILDEAGVRHETTYWERYGWPNRFGCMMVGYVHYLRVLLWPGHLSAHYFFPLPLVDGIFMNRPEGMMDGWAAVGIVLLGATLMLIVAGLVWRHRAALCGVWWVATLLPVANLVPMGAFVADRLLYMPSVAVCWLAGLGVDWILRRWPTPRARLAVGIALAVLIAGLTARTWVRNRDWRDPVVFCEALLRDSPALPDGPWALGQVCFNEWSVSMRQVEYYRSRGEEESARVELERARGWERRALEAYALSRSRFPDYDDAYFYEAWMLSLVAPPRLEEAEKLLRHILPTLKLREASYVPLLLADILLKSDRAVEAERHARLAIHLDKRVAARDPRFREALGIAFYKQGRFEEALAQWRRVAHLPGARAPEYLRAAPPTAPTGTR